MSHPEFEKRLLESLGGPWPEPPPLDAQVHQTRQADGYRIETVSYAVEPDDRVPALVLVPDGASARRPGPAICVWHQHNGEWHLGKSEPAGLAGNPMHHTGRALAKEGYVVLCPDAIGFEEREKPYRLKGGSLERFLFLKYLVAGKCLAWKNILDMRRAVEYLAGRDDVDPNRLGCYGHSMGSTFTWLIGPWEPRLVALVGNCCLPTYAGIHANQLLHCFPNFVPGLFAFGDTPDICALIAPRPLHLNFGETDAGSPIDEVRRALAAIADAYRAQHAERRFSHYIEPDTGHLLSPEMWRRTSEFFQQHLKG